MKNIPRVDVFDRPFENLQLTLDPVATRFRSERRLCVVDLISGDIAPLISRETIVREGYVTFSLVRRPAAMKARHGRLQDPPLRSSPHLSNGNIL